MKILLVGGTFGDKGTNGKKSTIVGLVADRIKLLGHELEWVNGGYFEDLEWVLKEKVPNYPVVLWFPNVSNDKVKIRDIKVANPKIILVTSKRNLEGKYSFAELVNHALGLKSNLVVEITRDDTGFLGRLFDPLACIWADTTFDFEFITDRMMDRLEFLTSVTREPTVRNGEAQDIPDESEFFALVKECAETFHNLIHPADGVERFLGNASFRCEWGFPGFRHDGRLFMSRRNVDKRFIDRDAFVEVAWDGNQVSYWGDHKPSVDTPIQVRLFSAFSNVKYILHSHVYVDGAPFTGRSVPCGAVEEFAEIERIFAGSAFKTSFSVNLIGHGSLVLSDNVEYMRSVEFVGRKAPEIMGPEAVRTESGR